VRIAWAIAAAVLLAGVTVGVAAAEASDVGSDNPSSSAFVAWASSAAVELRSVELGANGSDLRPFCEIAGRAPVLALGEPGHGAHQPLALRNRVFAYLVEHCGFTAIALETSFTESRAVHDYVAGGSGNAADLTRRSLSWGFGDYAENTELVEWMHDYNRHARGRRAIQFYGIDLSGADNDSGFPHPEIALHAVVEYVRAAAPARSHELLPDLAPVLDRISTIGYAALARRHDPALDSALQSLQRFLSENSRTLLRSSTRSQYDWAVRGLAVASRLRDMLSLDVEAERPGAPMPPDTYRLVNVRDAAMADNVLWVQQEEGSQGRTLVFAHNAHVMNAASRGGIWSVFSEAPRMMGQHLRSALGNSLVIIGTSAARSGDGLPAGPPSENNVEAALAKVGLPLFVLDLRGAVHDPGALAWLDERRPLRANFVSELDVDLREAFDALVFMDRLTPALKNASASHATP
jgi:erythromycin esterase